MFPLLTTFLALHSLVLALPFTSNEADWVIGQPVRTTSGIVQGKASTWQPPVSEYLGIPYAVPPVGDLRWAVPRRFVGSGSIDATKFVSAPYAAVRNLR